MAPALLLSLALLAETAAAPPIPASAPTDDYGLTAWCYGAVGGYLDLYDQVMPEVTRIERQFPSPGGVEASLKVYPEMRDQARQDLKQLAAAMQAAEKASPTAINARGAAAIAKGRAIWTGSTTVPKAQVAQGWMGWSPPAVCAPTAKRLEQKAALFGKALTYNNPAPPSAEAPPADDGSFKSEPKPQ